MNFQDSRMSNMEANLNDLGAIVKILETKNGQLALAIKD